MIKELIFRCNIFTSNILLSYPQSGFTSVYPTLFLLSYFKDLHSSCSPSSRLNKCSLFFLFQFFSLLLSFIRGLLFLPSSFSFSKIDPSFEAQVEICPLSEITPKKCAKSFRSLPPLSLINQIASGIHLTKNNTYITTVIITIITGAVVRCFTYVTSSPGNSVLSPPFYMRRNRGS